MLRTMSDDYEAKYMDPSGAIYREKHVARIFTAIFGAFALALAALGIWTIFTASIAGGLVPIAVAAIVALIALYFAVMRTTVTRRHIAIQYGTIGTDIPIDAITNVKLEEMIGTGPKWAPGGWLYAPLGTTRGVRITWSEEGKTKTCYIGASDADALASAIAEARTRKRVDAPEEIPAPIEEQEEESEKKRASP